MRFLDTLVELVGGMAILIAMGAGAAVPVIAIMFLVKG